MSNETPVPQVETKTKFSTLGLLSAIFGLIPFFPVCFSLFIAIDSNPGGDLAFGLISLGVLIPVCVFTPLSSVLGIIALFQKNRNKVFAIIGLSLTAILVIIAIIYVLFV